MQIFKYLCCCFSPKNEKEDDEGLYGELISEFMQESSSKKWFSVNYSLVDSSVTSERPPGVPIEINGFITASEWLRCYELPSTQGKFRPIDPEIVEEVKVETPKIPSPVVEKTPCPTPLAVNKAKRKRYESTESLESTLSNWTPSDNEMEDENVATATTDCKISWADPLSTVFGNDSLENDDCGSSLDLEAVPDEVNGFEDNSVDGHENGEAYTNGGDCETEIDGVVNGSDDLKSPEKLPPMNGDVEEKIDEVGSRLEQVNWDTIEIFDEFSAGSDLKQPKPKDVVKLKTKKLVRPKTFIVVAEVHAEDDFPKLLKMPSVTSLVI